MSSAALSISPNNTPREVNIVRPTDGSTYALDHDTILPMPADTCDAEHAYSELTCSWQTILHRDNHTHSEPFDTQAESSTVLTPVGCDGETYSFAIGLTVTDTHELSAGDSDRLLPACTPMSGNHDQDFNVDLADWAEFTECLGLSRLRYAQCQHGDLNQDGLADLDDFRILHGGITGPRPEQP